MYQVIYIEMDKTSSLEFLLIQFNVIEFNNEYIIQIYCFFQQKNYRFKIQKNYI